MILVIGLGNPGKKFEKTRHNIGFRAIDGIAANFQFPSFVRETNAQISEGEINHQKVILAKPQTFMNKSGKSVKLLTKIYNPKPDNLIIVHDDIDIPLGKIKISKGRGSAGHKGVESIIKEIKSKNFVRFRVGIKPAIYNLKPVVLKKIVLQKFSKEEEKFIEKIIKKTIEIVEFVLKEGLEKIMTKYNY